MEVRFPAGAKAEAFGFDYRSREPWDLIVGGTLNTLRGGRSGFVGVEAPGEAVSGFLLLSAERTRGGLSIDNISYLEADAP